MLISDFFVFVFLISDDLYLLFFKIKSTLIFKKVKKLLDNLFIYSKRKKMSFSQSINNSIFSDFNQIFLAFFCLVQIFETKLENSIFSLKYD